MGVNDKALSVANVRHALANVGPGLLQDKTVWRSPSCKPRPMSHLPSCNPIVPLLLCLE